MDQRAKKPARRATIKDVAARAGMSVLTVSRVINDHPSIKASTKARVQQAIEALRYQPDARAQAIRRQSTRTVGFLMPDFTHGVSAMIAQTVEQVLHKAGYTVMLACSHFDPQTECEALTTFERNRVDAIILKSCDDVNAAIVERVSTLSCPVIQVDRELPVDADAVVSNHREPMRDVVLHLAKLGHARIGLIAPSDAMRPGRERVAGFLEGMRLAKLKPAPELVAVSGQSMNYGYETTTRFMSMARPPSALIAAGNQIFYGTLEALRNLGLRYPADVSLVAADHPMLARVLEPNVSVIDRDPTALGKATADLLLARLVGADVGAPRQIMVPSRVILTESCGAVKPGPASRRTRSC